MTSTRNTMAPGRPSGAVRALLRLAVRVHNTLYRLSGGRVAGSIKGTPLLLLTTTGRKSGRQHTVPLSYLDQGDSLLVVGSAGGQPWQPSWCANVGSHPRVSVQIGGQRREMFARVLTEPERARLWRRFVEAYPLFEAYQRKVERVIPVVELRPAS